MNTTDEPLSQFELSNLSKVDCFKLLSSIVLPRPIAWVVSRNGDGIPNVAPFSFFNVISADPPLVAISFAGVPDRNGKDTLVNILETQDFVVNLVPEELAESMSLTSINAPRGIDESTLSNLQLELRSKLGVPRIAGSPVALECRLYQRIELGGATTIILASIIRAHVRTSVIKDAEHMEIDAPAMRLIGHMQGGIAYCRTSDTFTIERKNWPLNALSCSGSGD